tara:strand:- start:503 stop:964 length:462 start_codon:yes stop_codon:yes gene_type:complete
LLSFGYGGKSSRISRNEPYTKPLAVIEKKMASGELNRKLTQLRTDLFKKYGRSNKLPKVIIGAEYRKKRAVDHSGKCPNPLARKLEKELLKIGPLRSKGHHNFIGSCCEVRSSNQIMIKKNFLKPTDISFTKAKRTRTGQNKHRCPNCQIVFG